MSEPMTGAELIAAYTSAHTDMITALGEKGVTATDHGFSDFPDDIRAIPTGGGSGIPSGLPQDGATRIGYNIPEGGNKTIVLVFTHNTGDTISVVDWLDGSATETNTGNGAKTLTHTYASEGDCIAKITVSGGNIKFGGSSSSTIYGGQSNTTSPYIKNYVKWIVLGNGVVELGNYAFADCRALQEIRFPSTGLTTIGNNVFYYNVALKGIEIPNTVTTIGTSVFYSATGLEEIKFPAIAISGSVCNYCISLKDVTIPSGVTSIGNTAFGDCWNLQSVVIPATVTSIGTSTFTHFYGAQKIRFAGTTPPTLAGSNSFGNMPTSCVISVPTGYLSAYTSAQYYPSSSTYTYIEED